MRIVNHINQTDKKTSSVPKMIMDMLPPSLQLEINNAACGKTVEEIRLRQSRYSSLVCDSKNVMLGTYIDSLTMRIYSSVCAVAHFTRTAIP